MKNQNVKLQMAILFLGNFSVVFVGMGLFPLLPVYTSEMGATRAFIGLFFALIYAAFAAGPMVVGWIGGRVPHRVVFTIAGLLGIPALWLISYATELWQVAALTALVWFLGGVNINLVGIYTGLVVKGSSRGKSFSLMSLTSPLGALVGGTTAGQLLAIGGYEMVFAAMALAWAIQPAIGLWGLKPMDGQAPGRAPAKSGRSGIRSLSSGILVLLGLTLLSATAVSIGRLGTSMAMQAQLFSAEAIASTATVSGLLTIPVVMLSGVLSDRFGRRNFLVVSYLATSAGAGLLGVSTQLWQYWLAATLMLVAYCLNGAMSSALAADLLSRDELTRGLSWVNAANSVGRVFSFAGMGFLMDGFGPVVVFLIAALLPVASVAFLGAMARREAPVAEGCVPVTS